MNEIFAQTLALAYGSTGIVGVAAYWPTIKDLWRGKPSANVSSLYLFVNGLTLIMRLRIKN